MYDIDNNLLNRLRTEQQEVRLAFRKLNNNTEINVIETDVVSLSINRYCSDSNGIMIGNTTAAELNVSINNFDSKYTSQQFENCEVAVFVGVHDLLEVNNGDLLTVLDGDYLAISDAIPMGVFIVDEVYREKSTIRIVALDRMVKFDDYVDFTDVEFPCTIADMYDFICTKCGVTSETLSSSLPEKSYSVHNKPDDSELTYRRVLSMIAEINGMCAYFNAVGKLVMKWFDGTRMQIPKSDRFNSEVAENAVTITGVKIVDGDLSYVGGTEDYMIEITGNTLIQTGISNLASRIYTRMSGFTWLPYSAEIFSAPHLYPLDLVKVEGVNNDTTMYNSVVTDVTFKLNANTKIAGKGELASYKRSVITNRTKNQQNQIRVDEQTYTSKTEVAETYTSKTEFNALEVGGANLIKESNTYDYSEYDFYTD